MKLLEALTSKILTICEILYNCNDLLKCLCIMRNNYEILKPLINKALYDMCYEVGLIYDNCLNQILAELDKELLKLGD